jgi:hypothetical protein
MSEMKDGGPAFPVELDWSSGEPRGKQTDNRTGWHEGLSAVDYFMAHAPAEPQSWFKPVMEPAPKGVDFPADMTYDERNEYHGWGEYLGTGDLKCPRIRAYAEAVEAHEKLRRAWDAEFTKQHYIQWPRAWALEMLKERSK